MTFCAGDYGPWRVERIITLAGGTLPMAQRIAVSEDTQPARDGPAAWSLRGVTSNMRYTARDEADSLVARQEGLSRPASTHAALIPIRQIEAWWVMAPDERRRVLQEQLRHIRIGLDYLPGIARQLHQCRDLGEPSDFLTWFEYAPEETETFDELRRRLREKPEWDDVDREVDIRLVRDPGPN